MDGFFWNCKTWSQRCSFPQVRAWLLDKFGKIPSWSGLLVPRLIFLSVPFFMLLSMTQPHWSACSSPTQVTCSFLLLDSDIYYSLFLEYFLFSLFYPSLSHLLVNYKYYFKRDINSSMKTCLTLPSTQFWVSCPPSALIDHFVATAAACIIIYHNCLSVYFLTRFSSLRAQRPCIATVVLPTQRQLCEVKRMVNKYLLNGY